MSAETTPELLAVGDVILGARDQQPWTVEALTPSTATLVREGRSPVEVPRASLPPRIVLLRSAAEAEEMALALTQVRLGGEVVATREEGGPWAIPRSFVDVGSLLGHLYLFHQPTDADPKGAAHYPGDITLGALLKAHDAAHQTGVPAVQHVHTGKD